MQDYKSWPTQEEFDAEEKRLEQIADKQVEAAEPRRDEANFSQILDEMWADHQKYCDCRNEYEEDGKEAELCTTAAIIIRHMDQRAARASAAPLPQTDESLKVSLRELLDAANLVSYAECPSDADSDRYEAARVNAAKALADPPSLPQENADSLKPNFVAGEGLKTTPSAGQTEGKP